MKPVLLHTYKPAISSIISYLAKEVFPILIEISSQYNSLDMGQFNQEVYNDIVTNRHIKISSEFSAHLEKELKDSMLPSHIKKMMDRSDYFDQTMEPLIKSINEFHKVMTSYHNNSLRTGFIEFDDIKIIKSLPVIDEARITKRNQIWIEKLEHHVVLKSMQEVIEAFDKLRLETIKSGAAVMPEVTDFFIFNPNGTIVINPEVFPAYFRDMSPMELKALASSEYSSRIINR